MLAGVRLGNWGAKTIVDAGRDLVLAVDQRTQLAVVFPLEPAAAFRDHFAAALGAMLEELQVPLAAVRAETTALAFAPLTRLSDPAMRESLRTLQFICEIELMQHEELTVVQSNLIEFLHAPPPYVSKIAIARLFNPDRPMASDVCRR